MTLAVDVSNYTSELTPDALAAWEANDVGLIIIQSVDPPANYPPGKTRLQVRQCTDAGLIVDIYIWLWFDLDVSDIQRKLTLLEGLPPIRRLWLDVEDDAAANYDQAMCEAKVQAALFECDHWSSEHGLADLTGVYSGRWFWADARYMGNTPAFNSRDLWDANYDDDADAAAGFVSYGGWQSCAVKQWQGTTTFHGVSGVDMNALSAAESAKLTNGGPPPVADCATYKAAIERAVNRLQIELDRKTAAGKTAALRRTLVQEIEGELFQALQA